MRITAQAIRPFLKKGLGNRHLFLLFGREQLLLIEAYDLLVQQLQMDNELETIRYSLDRSFNWNLLETQQQSQCLLGNARLLICHLPYAAVDQKLKEFLRRFSKANRNNYLLLVMENLTRAEQAKAWYKSIQESGLIIEATPVKGHQLAGWIRERLIQYGLRFDQKIVPLIGNAVEGNLVAAAHFIEKLSLLYPEQTITTADIRPLLLDCAYFDVFQLVDAALSGQTRRALRVLQNLLQSGQPSTLILWALVREIRTIITILYALQSNQTRREVYQKHRVWSSRQTVVEQALNRHSLPDWLNLLQQAASLDLNLKAGRTDSAVGSINEQLAGLLISISMGKQSVA